MRIGLLYSIKEDSNLQFTIREIPSWLTRKGLADLINCEGFARVNTLKKPIENYSLDGTFIKGENYQVITGNLEKTQNWFEETK